MKATSVLQATAREKAILAAFEIFAEEDAGLTRTESIAAHGMSRLPGPPAFTERIISHGKKAIVKLRNEPIFSAQRIDQQLLRH